MATYLIDFAFSIRGVHRGATQRKLHNWLMRRHEWMEHQLTVVDSNPDFEVTVTDPQKKGAKMAWSFAIVGRQVGKAASGKQLGELVRKWLEKRYDYFAKYLRIETTKRDAISIRYYNPPIRD